MIKPICGTCKWWPGSIWLATRYQCMHPKELESKAKGYKSYKRSYGDSCNNHSQSERKLF